MCHGCRTLESIGTGLNSPGSKPPSSSRLKSALIAFESDLQMCHAADGGCGNTWQLELGLRCMILF